MTINELHGVQKTLLFPLWGRYSESIKKDGIICDKKCIELVEQNKIDFSEIENEQHPMNRIAWFTRAWNLDCELIKLIQNNSDVTVINIGCGLDTTYYRINDSEINWYNIDLSEVMDLREKMFDKQDKIEQITGSILDRETFEKIRKSKTVIFIAVGLLYYFSKVQVVTIFKNMQLVKQNKLFVIFDYCSQIGVSIANQLVLGKTEGVKMDWFADDVNQIKQLGETIRIIDNYPFFQKIMPKLTEQQKVMAAQSDKKLISSFIVLEM